VAVAVAQGNVAWVQGLRCGNQRIKRAETAS
jgi:hypothetical protein